MRNTLNSLHIFSFGGGVQSTAALVLAAQNQIPYKTFIFSNVGADSENPATLEYVEQISKPYAASHRLNLIETAWIGARGPQKGIARTLYADLLTAQKDIAIPMRLAGGGFGNRKCTSRYKIEPIARWTTKQGATIENPAVLGLGISWDESQRIGDSRTPWHVNHYPLIDLRLTRARCLQIIAAAGLPAPPKSSCWFCPFKDPKDWFQLDFTHQANAILLEKTLNDRRIALGKDIAFFAPGEKTLDKILKLEAEEAKQLSLFDGCDSGHCHT